MIEMHRQLAISCCEAACALMEKEARSRAETIEMLHDAHAACYHIGQAGGGEYAARCEWLLARAYVAAQMGNAALMHAERALELARAADADAQTRALCLEACARAHAALGRPVDADYCKQEAVLELARIDDEKLRAQVMAEIGSLTI